MEELVIIEWSFSPEDYIEHKNKGGNIDIEISKGKVKVTLPFSEYNADKNIREKLHNRVKAFFDAMMISKREPYTLSKPSTMERLSPDGNKHYTTFLETGHFVLTGGEFYSVHKDAAGNIIRDTKAEKKQAQLELSKLSAKHADDLTVSKLLQAYTASISDPANEFVHLYEIKDSLKTRFGKKSNVRKILGISDGDWTLIGKLSNDASIRQGRHRGNRQGDLRDATNDELAIARQTAKNMILAYLRYID